MSSKRTVVLEQAIAERARSVALRRKSVQLRADAAVVSAALVASIHDYHGKPVGGRGDRFELRVPVLPVALMFVRRELRRWLEACGLDGEVAHDLVLASSEACANAIEHPRSAIRQAIEIRARLSGSEVEIVVRDFGSWAAGTANGSRGRGLEMIRSLMDEVSVSHEGAGTVVTMRRALASDRCQSARAEIATST
jgi:anti-sigma regulatory factor (Ser/Thr protein kinase)